MREIVLTVAGLIIGGFFGVTFMCLFQINKDRHYFISRKDDKENEKKETFRRLLGSAVMKHRTCRKKQRRLALVKLDLSVCFSVVTSREKSPTKDFTMLCVNFPQSVTTSTSLPQKQTRSALQTQRSLKKKRSVGTSFRQMLNEFFLDPMRAI